ncbi:MAG: tellurite resistance TerB family protein [Hyphomicrobiaceae bacterium]|nr:tellurite resistance TerB family protein [Hyphomicrobiaceae bacterium]
MFDAKSLLEALINGGASRSSSSGGGGLGDLLGGLLPSQTGRDNRSSSDTSGNQQGGGIEDMLRDFMSGGKAPTKPAGAEPGNQEPAKPGGFDDLLRQIFPSGNQDASRGSQATDSGRTGGGLDDLLGQLQHKMGGSAGAIKDVLGDLLGQATSGAKEGATRIGEATGARDALEKMTGGKSANDLLNQLQDLIANNKLGAGAALGGLGALVLGTQTGRSLAATAAKIGALALIGGLAYRSYQNYTQGRPPVSDNNFVPQEPPAGSGFEPAATTNQQAALYIRAMIAAAAADGRISADEQQTIIGNLGQVGFGDGAEEFLANELNNPASTASLAAAAGSQQEAVQVYTAARIAIDPDTRSEQTFLAELARELGLPSELKTQIDAAALHAAA